jgi:hypothetical protein
MNTQRLSTDYKRRRTLRGFTQLCVIGACLYADWDFNMAESDSEKEWS